MISQKNWKETLCNVISKNISYNKYPEYPLRNLLLHTYGYTKLCYTITPDSRCVRKYEKIKNCTYPITNMMYNRLKIGDEIIDEYYKKAAEYFGSFNIRKTKIFWHDDGDKILQLVFYFEYVFDNNFDNKSKYINCLDMQCDKLKIQYYVTIDKLGNIVDEDYCHKDEDKLYNGTFKIGLIPNGDKRIVHRIL